MNKFRLKPKPQAAYATRSDFCRNFVDHVQPLYLLAFLLTGNHTEAEQCFEGAVEDALRANSVFKGWEESWSRRCLILNAIHRVFFGSPEKGGKADRWCKFDVDSEACALITTLARLGPPLQRFVFVMCVLEGYSERECALLLSRTPRDVVEARLQAFSQLSGLNPALAKTAG
jgi:DNA-directed RNA polymerase specialized sigma24 family protein